MDTSKVDISKLALPKSGPGLYAYRVNNKGKPFPEPTAGPLDKLENLEPDEIKVYFDGKTLQKA